MAQTIQVKLEGGDELVAKLRGMGIRVQDVLAPAMEAAAMLVRDAARGAAPGPFVEQETTKKTNKAVEVDVGPDKSHWYYRFFETGTAAHGPRRKTLMVFDGGDGLVFTRHVAGMAARPFLRPAADSQEQAAIDRVGADLRRAVESDAT